MSNIIDLNKAIPSSKIQPEIFKIKRQLKASDSPDYIAVLKGSNIEMVCINAKAWEEYQNYKLQKLARNKELPDQAISDDFSNISGKDFLENDLPLSQEAYNHYMSL